MAKQSTTPAIVRKLKSPTKEYMCKLSEGKNLDFLEFEIRDGKSNAQFYRIEREPESAELVDHAPEIEDLIRHVRYMLPVAMLRSRNIKTRLKFAVGDSQVQELLLIERHFFKGQLVRDYEHTFGPCPTGSTHVWEVQYDMPEYSEEEIVDFVETPDGHTSDSFYFADGHLVVHNKASFTYFDADLPTEAPRYIDETQIAAGLLTRSGGSLPKDAGTLRMQHTGGLSGDGPGSCANTPRDLHLQCDNDGCEGSGKGGGTGGTPSVASAADALAAKLNRMA